jgi:hypothetical protein
LNFLNINSTTLAHLLPGNERRISGRGKAPLTTYMKYMRYLPQLNPLIKWGYTKRKKKKNSKKNT